MSEKQPNTFNLSDTMWNAIRLAALAFALSSIWVFISSRNNEPESEVALVQEDRSFIHSIRPDGSTYEDFQTAPNMFTPQDASSIPDRVDENFVSIVLALLEQNEADEFNCISSYSLLRYSNVNAQITEESVLADTFEFGGSCGGGVVRTYSLLEGAWTETPFIGQASVSCDDATQYGLFDEFSGTCLVGESQQANPYGSILDW